MSRVPFYSAQAITAGGAHQRRAADTRPIDSRLQFISFSQPSNVTGRDDTPDSSRNRQIPEEAVARSRHLEIVEVLLELKQRLTAVETTLKQQSENISCTHTKICEEIQAESAVLKEEFKRITIPDNCGKDENSAKVIAATSICAEKLDALEQCCQGISKAVHMQLYDHYDDEGDISLKEYLRKKRPSSSDTTHLAYSNNLQTVKRNCQILQSNRLATPLDIEGDGFFEDSTRLAMHSLCPQRRNVEEIERTDVVAVEGSYTEVHTPDSFISQAVEL